MTDIDNKKNESEISTIPPLGARLGEGIFCIVYLIYVIVILCIMKYKASHVPIFDGYSYNYAYDFGFMLAFLLLIGDSFHLVPRILVCFKGSIWKQDVFLGIGSLLSSITMTLYYNVLMAMGDTLEYHESMYNLSVEEAMLVLTAIRIVLLLFPQNKWFTREPARKWAIIRNVPFVLIGLLTVYGFIKVISYAYNMSITFYVILIITVILSFAFYLPVAILAKEKPKLGMLMIPKTICYMVMLGVICFY